MSRYQNDPRQIIAKYPTTCPETGNRINKGDPCFYFPTARKCYDLNAPSVHTWLDQQAADSLCLADAGW